MSYEIEKIKGFTIVGVPIRTINAPGRADVELKKHWEDFFKEGFLEKIPNKIDTDVLGLYCDYAGGYQDEYTMIIGTRVRKVDYPLLDGLVSQVVPDSKCAVFTAKGKMPDCLVESWMEIWQSDIDFGFKNSFEVYDMPNFNPENATVPIYMALKE